MVRINKKAFYDQLLAEFLPFKRVGPSKEKFRDLLEKYSSILEKQKARVRETFPVLAKKANLESAAQLALFNALQRHDLSSYENLESFLHSYVRAILVDSLAYYNERRVFRANGFTQTGLSEKQQRYFKLFLTKLPREEKLITILYLYEEMTFPEIAATLDISKKEVKRKYNNITIRLKGGIMLLGG